MASAPKLVVLVCASIFLASCSTELFDQSYSPYPSEFDPGNGVVTIFRESHFVGGREDVFITVGDRKFGDIGNGAGIKIGLPSGKSNIDIHSALSLSHLSIPINIEPGKDYYVELAAQSGYMVGAVPYLLSQLKAKVNQYCGAGWCADIEDKSIALPKIEKIHFRERITKSSF